MFSSTALPSIPPVTYLSPLITRVLGQNPGPRTLQGTNSYLIGSPTRSRVLIDTTSRIPGLQTYLNILRKELERCSGSTEPPLSAVICTHWHPDHTEAISAVLNLSRELAQTKLGSSPDPVPVFKYPGGPRSFTVEGFQCAELTHNQCFPVSVSDRSSYVELRVLFTPGHAADHVALLLEVDSIPVGLFSGDMILGHGSTTVHNLPDYMRSLYRTRNLLDRIGPTSAPVFIYPAHGLEVRDSRKKIEEYIENRLDRVAKTIEYLSSQPANVWFSESGILHAVYPQVPCALHTAALLNLRHSLFWIQSMPDHELPKSVSFRRSGLVARIPEDSLGLHDVTLSRFVELIGAYEESLFQSGQKPLDTLAKFWEWKISD